MLQSLPDSLTAAKPRRSLGLAITMLLLVGSGSTYWLWRSQSSPASSQTVISAPPITTVTALGRLEPQGEVIRLSAPTSSNGNRVEELRVQVGDRIQAGEIVAVLDSRDRLQAAYEQAQEDVRVAEAQLAITQAGAKQGEIDAQQAEIVRLEAQHQGDIDAQLATVARLTSALNNAAVDYNRYEALYRAGGISASDRDSRRLALETAQRNVQEAQAVLARTQSTSPAQLNQAKANLARITEVRPVEVNQRQAEVERAIAAMNQAKAALDQAYVRVPAQTGARSPQTYEVLAVQTQAGEVVGSEGIVEIGATRQMMAVAEVYQSDVGKVKLGQSARIRSDSIPGELRGTVSRIDAQVKRQAIVNTDPSTNIDGRVVEVQIALDAASSPKAAKFTNLQITAVIEP